MNALNPLRIFCFVVAEMDIQYVHELLLSVFIFPIPKWISGIWIYYIVLQYNRPQVNWCDAYNYWIILLPNHYSQSVMTGDVVDTEGQMCQGD